MSVITRTTASTIGPLEFSEHACGSGPSKESLAQKLFPAGWPFMWFFVGYPLWWLLGVTWLAAVVACSVMLSHLYRRAEVLVPRHFGWWLLLLAWALAGVFLVQVDAPGAVAGASGTRYFTWFYRILVLSESTVMLIYLCTLRREFTWRRISRTLGWMFVYLAIGGLLGVLVPTIQFPSLFEVILPRHLAAQPFINSLIHPTLAQVQEYLGVVTTRPSAPFPYANDWGLNYVCFLPFFVVGWCQNGGHRRRVVSVILLAASAVPLVLSLNRTVWGVVAVLVLYVTIRGAVRGHFRLAAACVVIACIGSGALAVTPLGNTIHARLSGEEHTSDQGRANLGILTATSAWERSPVAGFGTTRDVQGSFQSIAIGTTASCPGCSGPALGTQGVLWLLIFAVGFGGTLLYIGFLLLHFIRSMRSRAPSATLASTTLIAYLLTLPFYDLGVTSQVAVFAAIALLTSDTRRGRTRGLGASGSGPRELRHYLGLIRRQLYLLMVAMCCGLVLGAAWQYRRGTPYIASVPVAVGTDKALQGNARPMTLDTVAQFALSRGDALDRGGHTALHVTASPYSRILHVSVTADSAQRAKRAAVDVADVALRLRTQVLARQKSQMLSQLQRREGAMRQSISALTLGIHSLGTQGTLGGPSSTLVDRRSAALTTLAQAVDEEASTRTEPVDAGRALLPAHVRLDNQQWTISLVSGALVGLLIGAILAAWREQRSSPLCKRLRRNADRTTLPPVLATVQLNADSTSYPLAVHVLGRIPGIAILPVGDDPASCEVADILAARIPLQTQKTTITTQSAVALVLTARCRVRCLNRARERLERQGARVCGLVVVDSQVTQLAGESPHAQTRVHSVDYAATMGRGVDDGHDR